MNIQTCEINSIGGLFQAFGRTSALATAVGRNYQTVRFWKRRGKIPPESWPSIIEAGKTVGLELTEADYFRIHGMGESEAGA